MQTFCTYCNSGYLDRTLVLLESMRRWIPAFRLHVLAFDDGVIEYFTRRNDPDVLVERLADFETRNPDVAAVKTARSRAEYFFTCTPAWIHDVIERHPEIDVLAYLDADLCFFAPSDAVFAALGDRAILVTEHDFAPRQSGALSCGRFNVGLLAFRNAPTGRACVRHWRDQCVAWCFDRQEDGKFADQKYLDAWPDLYGAELVVAPPGINTGPWGLRANNLTRGADGSIRFNGYPLIAYHFQGVRLFSEWHYYAGYYFPFNPQPVLSALYEPYARKLAHIGMELGLGSVPHDRYGQPGWAYRMATGYWVGHPFLNRLIWRLQRYVLRLA